jgi:response regulator RpfG family c-di-GMP phosphodiesterase
MSDLKRISALVIEPDVACRMRLKQAMLAIATFGKQSNFGDLGEAFQKLPTQGSCDLVFLSARFPQEDLKHFIQEAKKVPATRDSAFVVLLSAESNSGAKVADQLLGGAHGLLFEPFSVDSLGEITELAWRVKRENQALRQKAALAFLVKELADQLDVVAELKASGYEAGVSIKNLREMCSPLNALDGELEDAYFTALIGTFSNLPPKAPRKPLYRGASKRVRQRSEHALNQDVANRARERQSA